MTSAESWNADDVGDWRVLDSDAFAWFEAPSMAAGAALVARIAELAGDRALPEMDLRPSGVRVRVGTDVRLARSISTAARDLGLTASPSLLQRVGIVMETAQPAALEFFWVSVLGYEASGHHLRDPQRRHPDLTLVESEARTPRDRVHLDAVRPEDAVEAVKAAVVQEPSGPYGLALADPDGNVVDVVPGGPLADSSEIADWQGLFGAMASYPVGSPAQASALVTAAAGLADAAGLPLVVDVRPDAVTIDSGKDLWETPDGSADSRFVELAGRIQGAARQLGLAADPARPRFVQLGIDAVDVPVVRAFWAAALGYELDPREHVTDINDPRRLGPVLFFQPMEAGETERREHRNRIHLELHVPPDLIDSRLEAALAVGGRVVEESPIRRTVADPEGNELDLVTSGDR